MRYADLFAEAYDVRAIERLIDSGEEYIIVDTYQGFLYNMGLGSGDHYQASEAMDEIAYEFDLPYLSVSDYNDLVIDMMEY